jgi:hypothetical protein
MSGSLSAQLAIPESVSLALSEFMFHVVDARHQGHDYGEILVKFYSLLELVTEIAQCFGIEDENILDLLVNRTVKT